MAASFLQVVSGLCGWVYTLCWSLSFYPQPILNFRRRSTTGTTIDFPVANVIGFLAYFISCTAFIYSPQIRNDYAARHHGLTPTVQINDLAFAAHALAICLVVASQFIPGLWGFDKQGRTGPGARISSGMLGIIIGSFLGVFTVAFIVAVRNDPDPATGWAWIDTVSYYASLVMKEYTEYVIFVRSMPYPTSKSSSHSSNTCRKSSPIIEINQHMDGPSARYC